MANKGKKTSIPDHVLRAKSAVVKQFLRQPKERGEHPLVTGVGIAVSPHKGGTSIHHVVLFAEAVSDAELQHVHDSARRIAKRHKVRHVVMRTGVSGALAGRGPSISPLAPDTQNVPPALAGTLGAVTAADEYVLSCNHVLAFNGRVLPDAEIVSPATLDQTVATPDRIATRSYFVELKPAAWPIYDSPANTVDCALAKMTPVKADKTHKKGLREARPATAIEPGKKLRVQKTGSSTGTTTGTVCFWHWEGYIDHSFGTFYFEDLIGILGDGPSPFAAPGDSGSIVDTEQGAKPLGLVMARVRCRGGAPPILPRSFDGYIVLACALTNVVEKLSPMVGSAIQFRS